MAFETAQDFIDVWAELDAAYVTFPALAGAGGNYQDDTPLDTTGGDFDSVLAEFPEFAFILDNPDATVGQLALAVNSMFVALAEAYIDYLDGGGDPILDIAKDRGGDPAPGQSYHDNILGNLGDGAIQDRFDNASNDSANNVDVTGDGIGDLVSEPRSADGQDFGGRPYVTGSSNNDAFGQAIAWDIAHGIDQSKLDVSRDGADPTAGEVYVVDSDGAVSQFSSIQAAVDAAAVNDSIVIGAGTWNESVVIDKALSIYGAGADQTFIEPASGDGLEIEGDLGTDATVTIDGITFANATGSGVSFDDYAILGTLEITDSAFVGNSRNGVHIGDNANPIDLDNVLIEDSTFTGNGEPQGSSGDGDIIFYEYNGDATLRNLDITGQDRGTGPAENAIQFLSNHGAMGNVVLENITIDGVYEKTGIAIYEYDNVDGLSVTGVTINAVTGWNLPVNFDGVGGDVDMTSLDIDASGAPGVISLQGNDGDNALTGNDGDNFLRGGAGDDVLTGNGGNDSAYFSGSRDDYDITQNGDGSYTFTDTNLANGDEGSDTVAGIETVSFGGDPVLYELDTNSPDQSGFNVHFSQGFEGNSAGILTEGGYGSVTIANSGDNGITAADGSHYAIFQQTGDPGNETGPFTRFDGYSTEFGQGYNAQVKIYLDPNWADGDGFDWSVAANGQDGAHEQDFIFHVTKDADTGTILIGGSNNSNFDPIDNLETGNHGSVDQAGWYTFETQFYENEDGNLEVALNVYDSNGDWVFTEIRTNETDSLDTDIGGHRYGWFTNIDVDGGIAVDSMSMSNADAIGQYQLQHGEAKLGDFGNLADAAAAAGEGDVVTNGAGTFYVEEGMSIQAAIDAASDGDTIHIGDGSYTENLVIDKALSFVGEGGATIDPASGTAVHIEAGIDGDISFDGVNLAGTGSAAIGIDVDEGANIGTLTFTNGDISGFDSRGIYASDDGDPDGTPTMANLVVTNVDFFGNGTGSGNTADVKLFGFSGNATFDTVTFDGADGVAGSAGRPDSAIEITGYIDSEGNAHPLGPDAPDANITLNNVIVTGEYHKNPIALFHFSEIDGISITGLDLSGAESAWGPLFNLDGIEDADLDASIFGIIFPEGTDIYAELQGEETGQGTIDSTITGTDTNDSIHGKGGNDTLYGGQGADRLFGGNKPGQNFEEGQGDDNLYGQAGDDTLSGGLGDDHLDGGDGADVLVGGAGADYNDGGAGEDVLSYAASGDGVDVRLWRGGVQHGGDAEGDTVRNVEVVLGSDFNDVLQGNNGLDVTLDGAGGDDNLAGFNGNDALYGGDGDDRIAARDGDDFIMGGAGADIINGGDGTDTISYANSSAGVEVRLFQGGAQVGGEAAGDIIRQVENVIGSDFDDILQGNNGINSVLSGGAGNDEIRTYNGDDTLNGGDGNDVLVGGSGDDVFDGGSGNDAIYFTGNYADYTVDFDAGTITDNNAADGDDGSDTFSNVEILVFADQTVTASGGPTATEGDDRLIGDGDDNTIDGLGGDDIINGNGGDDILIGGAGDDIIVGRNGDDLIRGGSGADAMKGDDGFDTVDYSDSDSGVDIRLYKGSQTGGFAEGDVLRSFEGVIGSDFDDSLRGDTGINVTLDGRGGDDIIVGYDGDDILRGGDGDDRLVGHEGDDLIEGGAGADIINGREGIDTADYSSSSEGVYIRLYRGPGQVGGDAEGDILRQIENVIGSQFDDDLRGDLGLDSVLDGQGGDDILIGFDGDDTFLGGDGDDRLISRDGNDVLDGGAGNDILRGQGDADTFIMGIGGGVDTIADFEDGVDVIDLTAFAVSDVNDLTISQVNNVTLISGFGDDGEMLRLVNVDQGDIDNSDFLFGA